MRSPILQRGSDSTQPGNGATKLCVGGYPFVVGSQKLSLLDFDGDLPLSGFAPCTILVLPDAKERDSDSLARQAEEMLSEDDVFNGSFLSKLVFLLPPGTSSPSFTDDAQKLVASWGSDVNFARSEVHLPSGPYSVSAGGIFEVMRLYPDPYEAFVCGIIPLDSGSSRFQELPFKGIPVPSRLYFGKPTKEQPLLGKRIGVKDVFDINGVPTTISCRAYASFYGNATTTAPSIIDLVTKGAVLVGKTKTAQFASGENPQDWVDYQCPFNPRGDGYQDTSCSSAGSAAAIAGYEWLDFSLGTDSLGSIVWPAALQGIFGIRPTHGKMNMDGVVPLSSKFDTLGYFSRDINSFRGFGSCWYEGKMDRQAKQFPKKIIYPLGRFEGLPSGKIEIIEHFIEDLENTTRINKTCLDIPALWKQICPAKDDRTLKEYVGTVTMMTLAHIQLHDCYHNNAKFRHDYTHETGHEPYVNPMIRYKWKLGREISSEQYNTAIEEQDTFKSFITKHVISEQTIMILPLTTANVMSPEEVGNSLQGFGLQPITFSALTGFPMLSFPIGEYLIKSKVTGAMVSEPVALGIIGPPGSEDELITLVQRVLIGSGRPLTVRTGSNVF